MKLFFAMMLAFTPLVTCATETAKRMNVLFVSVDDLRPELKSYGHPVVKSPNFDKLASEGMQFNRAYCQLALCNPSRASLLSGRRPETLGIYDLATFLRDGNVKDIVTLPELFKNNGYTSLRFGKIFHTTNGNHDDLKSWSENPGKNDRSDAAGADEKTTSNPTPKKPGKRKKAKPGADPHANELPYGAPDVADDALSDGKIANRVIEALRENKDESFFIGVGFHKPHLPFVAPKKYWDMYDESQIKLAPNSTLPADAPAFATNDASELRRYKSVPKQGAISDEQARRLIHGYYACVSYIDAQLGKIVAELDALGLRENTVIIVWGDHGYHLGEQGTWNKRTNWEIATRVPLIISYPDQETRGTKTNKLVEFVDIYPTLVELCGLPMPEKLEGTSLLPLLRDAQLPWKTAAFSVYEKEIPGMGNGLGRAMRTERYRFIEWSAEGNEKRIHELYDHQVDPQETTNIANNPENAELVAKLSKQLAQGWKHALPPKK